nr:MAG TPA: minor tail protein [Caudoviricetes sp.]
MGETLEDGVDLGQVTGALSNVGISVLDSNGKMREVGNIMEDLMGVWSQMDQTQKAAIATTLAGKYQLSRFEALMNRSDLYNTYKQSAQEGKDKGTLDVMNEKYVDSLEGRLNKLQATFEGLFSNLFETTDFNPLIDGLTTVVDLMNQFITSIGGGSAALTGLGAVAMRVFSNSMARGLNNFVSNRKATEMKKENQRNFAEKGLASLGLQDVQGESNKKFVDVIQNNLKVTDSMSTEQAQEYNQKVETAVQLKNQQIDKEQELYRLALAINAIWDETLIDITRAEDGSLKVDLSKYQSIIQSSSGRDLIDSIASEQDTIKNSADTYAKQYAAMSSLKKRTSIEITGDESLENLHALQRELIQFRDSIKKTYDIADLGDAQVKEDLNNLIAVLGSLNEKTLDTEESANKLQKAFYNIQASTNKAGSTFAEMATSKTVRDKTAKADIHEAVDAVSTSREFADQAVGDVEAEGDKLESQEKKKDIINTVSAVGDLFFAWQSFQELGSLFSKDDITTGEKLVTTIQNVAMTAPMAAMGLMDMSKGLHAIGIAEKTANIAAGILGVITAIVSVVSAYKQYKEELYNNEQSSLDEVKKSSDEAIKSVSNWETLYQAYMKTGEASDEFKKTSAEIADQLGVEGAAALEAAGNYDVLAQAIKSKKDAELQKTIDENRNAITSGELSKSINGSLLNGSLEADRNAAYSKAIGGKNVDKDISDILTSAGLGDAKSPEEIISATNAALDKIRSSKDELGTLDEYKEKMGDTQQSVDEWTRKTENLNRAESELNNLLNQQDLSDYAKSISDMASARVQQSDFVSSMKNAGNDISKIQNLFNTDSSTFGYMKSISNDWNKQLQFMIDSSQDATQKIYLQAQQATYQAAVKARQFTGSDEIADQVYKTIDKSSLSDSAKVSLVATLDKNTSYENFKEVINDFIQSPEGRIDLKANLDKDSLKLAQSEKSNFQGMLDSYESAYQKQGGFTEDEAAKIIASHPEYLEYLQQVGNVYQLNSRALEQWNQLTREQTDAMNNLKSSSMDLTEQNKDLSIMIDKLKGTDIGDALQGIKDLNLQMMEGNLSNGDFLDGLTSGFDKLTDAIQNSGQEFEDWLSDVNNTNFSQLMLDELYGGLQQISKQFQSGQANVADYSSTISKAARQSIKLQKAQYKLSDSAEDAGNGIHYVEENTEGMSDEQKKAAKSVNKMITQLKELDAASDFNNYVTDNYEQMLNIFDESGQVLQSAANEAGGIQEQYAGTIAGLADTMTTFYSQNEAAATSTAQNIAAVSSMSIEQAKQMLMTGEGLSQAMMSNTAVAGAAMEGTMNQTSAAIGNMSAGISAIISAIMATISSINGEVSGTVEPSGESTQEISVDNNTTGEKQVLGTVHVPGFKMRLQGSGSANTSSAAGGSTYKGSDGKYYTDIAAEYNNENGALVTGTGGTREATTDEILNYGSNKLSEGLAGIFGANQSAKLQDWAPAGAGSTYTPSSFGGSDAPSGGGGGKGGGGGGGGGSDDNFDDSQKDFLEDELDLYERVNTELSKMEKHLDGLDQEYDRLIGYNKANNMDKQIQDYHELIRLAKQKLEIQQQEAQDIRGKLSGYGVQFNGEGIITNYAQIFNQLKGEYDSLVSAFNSSTDKAYKEGLSDQMEAAEKSFDKFKDYIDRYDTLIGDEIKSSLNQIEEYYDKIEDLRIQAFNDAMDAIDNIQDLNDTMSELKGLWTGLSSDSPFRKMVEDASKLEDYFNLAAGAADKYYDTIINDYKKAAEQATNDTAKNFALQQAAFWQARKSNAANEIGTENGTGLLDMRLNDLEAVLKYFNGTDEDRKNSIWGDNEAAALEALETAYKNLAQAELDASAQAESLLQDIIDGYEEIGDEFDKMAEAYENLTDTIDHYSNMVESLYGEEDYDRLLALMETKQNTLLQNIRFQQNQVQYWEQELAKYDKETEREKWEEVHSQLVDAQKDMNDLAESAAENLANIYETQTDKFLSDWKNKLLGGDADFAEMQWELSKKNAELYLDDVERAYNTEKLRAKYQQMLNNTTDPSIQRQIADAMNEQVSALQERVKLSQYDVDYANAQLEILQKRIALEEAQRNKSQMKLKRDAQGNYSYVYTANKDNVDNAQSDLLDSEQNAYELTKNNAISLQENYFSALNDYAEKARQIREKNKGDEATMKEQLQALWDSYKEYLTGLAQQLGVTQADMIESVRQMSEDSQGELSDYYTNIADAMENNWSEAMDNIGISTSSTVIAQLQDLTSLEQATNDLMNNFNRSAAEYGDYVNKIEQDTQTSYGNVGELIDGVTDKQKALTDATEDFWNLVRQDTDQINKNNAALISYREEIEKLQDSTSKANQAMREAQELASAKEQEARDWESKYTELKTAVDNGSYFNQGGGGGGGSVSSEEAAFGIAQNIWTYGSWENDPVRRERIISRYGEDVANRAQEIVNDYYYSGRAGELYNTDSWSWGYDTGGYTGTWSDKTDEPKNGKLAYLHQKELVLNESDTQNILDAVSLVREFTKQLKSNSLSSLFNSWMGSYSQKDNEQTVKQDVHITAEFPNVNSASEIETALESLNQRAYQYVQKYR